MAVEGFFAFVWFGWGQAAPPSWLVAPLAVGAGLAVLLTAAGIVLTGRPLYGDPSDGLRLPRSQPEGKA